MVIKTQIPAFICASICLLCLLACGESANGQDFSRKGLVKLNLGLSQGFMLNYSDRPVFADGFAEWFPEEKISLKGECLYMIGSRSNNPVIKINTSILFGFMYHFTRGKNDLSVGIQPGLSMLQPEIFYTGNLLDLHLYPSLVLSANYSLYFSRFCHFYCSLSHFTSVCRGSMNGSLNLSSFMVTGGLGFHIQLKNSK